MKRAKPGLNGDVRFQFHLSVEEELLPFEPFSRQARTESFAGERGEAGGEGIYTTHNLAHWATQLAYEGNGRFPRNVYVVAVREGSEGTIWSAHQDLSPPEDVVVLCRIGDLGDPDDDTVPDYGRIRWQAEKWLHEHATAVAAAVNDYFFTAVNREACDDEPTNTYSPR